MEAFSVEAITDLKNNINELSPLLRSTLNWKIYQANDKINNLCYNISATMSECNKLNGINEDIVNLNKEAIKIIQRVESEVYESQKIEN